jgi:hypothetical protein
MTISSLLNEKKYPWTYSPVFYVRHNCCYNMWQSSLMEQLFLHIVYGSTSRCTYLIKIMIDWYMHPSSSSIFLLHLSWVLVLSGESNKRVRVRSIRVSNIMLVDVQCSLFFFFCTMTTTYLEDIMTKY